MKTDMNGLTGLYPNHIYWLEVMYGKTILSLDEAILKMQTKVSEGLFSWFHGIEFMTLAQNGNVYYKGVLVENYDPRYEYTKEAKENTEKLSKACKRLEMKKPLLNWGIWDAINEKRNDPDSLG